MEKDKSLAFKLEKMKMENRFPSKCRMETRQKRDCKPEKKSKVEKCILEAQGWRDLFMCRIDLLNFSMGFNIVVPFMEFLHLN